MKLSTVRLEMISDGITAIIITIMVLELKLPALDKENGSHELLAHLRHLLPYFVTYAFSFMMIAILWNNHHHMFHLLEKTDQKLLWQNFVFLFFQSLIPFATAIVGANPWERLSPVIYGSVMLLTMLSFAVMRQHSLRSRLTHKDEDSKLTAEVLKVSKKARRKAFIGTAIYCASIPLAFISVYLAYACFIIPPVLFFIPEGIDDEELASKVDEKNG